MLDTRIDKSVNFPSTIEITKHEHRAPTDASVRLLREMEEKAREQVALSMVTNNAVSACAVYFRDVTQDAVVAFKLNGQEYVTRSVDMRFALLAGDSNKVMEIIAKHVANAIIGKMRLEVP